MYDVKVYDATTEANRQLSAHIQVHEFACKDGSRPVFISQTLVDILENIRVHFGAPLHINSAYRTVAYNAKQKGSSPKSQHCNGLAADIWVEGHTPAEVYAYAETLLGNHGGLGIYNTFVHIDVRADKSRWDYRTA